MNTFGQTIGGVGGGSSDPSAMNYKGAFNADSGFDVATGTITLANGAGDIGDYWRIAAQGTHNFGAGNVELKVGDVVVYNGTTWDLIPAANDTSAWNHITDTTLAPATTAEPLVSEIQAFVDAITDPIERRNKFFFYTGTDVATDSPIRSYFSDENGLVKIIYNAGKTVQIIREDFDGLTVGQSNFLITAPFPGDTTLIEVYRNGRLVRETDDYLLNIPGNQVDLVDSIVSTLESIVVKWTTEPGGEYRQDFTPLTGTTNFTITVNGGVLPSNTQHIFVYRNGRLLREGAANDYTIVGNDVVMNLPSITNESFIVTFNIT